MTNNTGNLNLYEYGMNKNLVKIFYEKIKYSFAVDSTFPILGIYHKKN